MKKDLIAWKESQEKKYEAQFLKIKEEAKAAAAEAEAQRGAELALIRQDNEARSAEMESLRSAMDTFQTRLMGDFGKVLDERLRETGEHQRAMAAELKQSQELAASRFESLEHNMKLLMSKLLGPEPAETLRPADAPSPGNSPAAKKAKAVIVPAHSLGSSAEEAPSAAEQKSGTSKQGSSPRKKPGKGL